jgi:hypothetical protein
MKESIEGELKKGVSSALPCLGKTRTKEKKERKE